MPGLGEGFKAHSLQSGQQGLMIQAMPLKAGFQAFLKDQKQSFRA